MCEQNVFVYYSIYCLHGNLKGLNVQSFMWNIRIEVDDTRLSFLDSSDTCNMLDLCHHCSIRHPV